MFFYLILHRKKHKKVVSLYEVHRKEKEKKKKVGKFYSVIGRTDKDIVLSSGFVYR